MGLRAARFAGGHRQVGRTGLGVPDLDGRHAHVRQTQHRRQAAHWRPGRCGSQLLRLGRQRAQKPEHHAGCGAVSVDLPQRVGHHQPRFDGLHRGAPRGGQDGGQRRRGSGHLGLRQRPIAGRWTRSPVGAQRDHRCRDQVLPHHRQCGQRVGPGARGSLQGGRRHGALCVRRRPLGQPVEV